MSAHSSRALAALFVLLAGCTGGSTPAAPATPAAAPHTPTVGALRHDTPFAQVAAEARRRGAPILMYFWTDW